MSEKRDPGVGDPRRRRLLGAVSGAAGTLVLTLGPFDIARGATLLGVRVWPAADYTRVTLEHNAELKFNHFVIRDTPPLRLVVDIEGIELTPQLRELVGKVDADDPYIAQVRLGQNRPRVVRLVVELKEDIRPQVFALAPVGPYRHRLVVDLHPTTPRDPLLALLRQQEPSAADPARADPARADPARAEPARAEPPRVDAARSEHARVESARTEPDTLLRELEQRTFTPAPEPEPGAASRPRARGPAEAAKRGTEEPKQDVKRVITIAIDAGHGGEDPGAVGRRGTLEKNVTLSIARRLEALIKSQSDMRVLLTRDGDFFVPLGTRVAKARAVSADLLVSLHADAWIRPDVQGSSVFALSERGATSAAAAWMARRENDADLIGGVNLNAHDAGLARVLLDLSTTAQINDSLKLGNAVLRELERINRLHKPQVEQAGFAVLKAPDIPSILVETAFISNPHEELRLKDERYQNQVAAAIFNGINRYFRRHAPTPRSPVG